MHNFCNMLIGYSTLKKEWSISHNDYITLGLTDQGKYIVLSGNQPISYLYDTVEPANEVFYFHVNKI